MGQNDTLDPAGQDRFKTRTGNHRNLEETSSTCEKPLNEDDRHETAHMAITIVCFPVDNDARSHSRSEFLASRETLE